MEDVITFFLTNADGTPKTDAAPTFDAYVSRNGFARPATPAIAHVSGGEYRFVATADDVAEGVAYAINSGAGAYPERVSGGVYRDAHPFAVMLLTTAAGALWAGAAPTVGVYKDGDGVSYFTIPSPVAAKTYLYTLTPVVDALAGDQLIYGVIYRLDAPATAIPPYVSGEFDAQGTGAPVVDVPIPATSSAIAYNAAAYLRQLKLLLPPGRLFSNIEADSYVSKTLAAYAEELARIDTRGVQLIEESDPRTADETIEQWEEMLSLPDDQVLEIPATLEERQIAITQKYTARGGQNEDYFTRLCAACGWTLAGGELATPAIIPPLIDSLGGGGTLGAGTYSYRITALSRTGETVASVAESVVIAAGVTNKVQITWARVPGAVKYRVYGRTAGSETYIATVTNTTAFLPSYVDTGVITPTGLAPPGFNSATYPAIILFVPDILRAGFRVDDRCYGAEYAYAMELNLQPPAGAYLAQEDFERVIEHRIHAHIHVIFTYH